MKLSTKGRYAARALIEMVKGDPGQPITIKSIACSQGFSEKYLENIMSLLISSGIVKSVRGKGGGFSLGRDPESITLLDILNSTEGNMAVVECIQNPSVCERSSACVTREIWTRVSTAIEDVLKEYTLRTMSELATARERCHVEKEMYFI